MIVSKRLPSGPSARAVGAAPGLRSSAGVVRGVFVRRSLSSADWPAPTLSSYHAAAFVPVRAGFTVGLPLTT